MLVNPGSTPLTVNLGASYQLVTASGGGDLSAASLDAAGNYIGGNLSQQAVTSVTLAAGSAAILLKSTGTATPNQAPVLAAIANQTVNEGSTLRLTAAATDADGAAQTLTYRLAPGAPAGASINASTGVFTWQPTDGPKSYAVTVVVTDNGSPALSDSKTFTVTVNNVAPTATFSGPTSVTAGAAVTMTFSSPRDPSAVDAAAGFTYSFDFNNDGIYEVANAASPSASFTFTAAGGHTIRGRITDKDGGTTTYTCSVTVLPAAVSTLAVAYPSGVTAGTSHQLTVTAQDVFGNTVTGYRGTVHFVSSDAQAVLPVDYLFTSTDQGRHTFYATLKTAGSQQITALDLALAGLQGTRTGITVNPASAKSFRITGPASAAVGVPLLYTVTALDAYGNVATGYRGSVHFSNSDPLATVPADHTFTSTDAGVYTFSVTFKTLGLQSLTVRDKNTTSIFGTQLGIDVLNASLPAA